MGGGGGGQSSSAGNAEQAQQQSVNGNNGYANPASAPTSMMPAATAEFVIGNLNGLDSATGELAASGNPSLEGGGGGVIAGVGNNTLGAFLNDANSVWIRRRGGEERVGLEWNKMKWEGKRNWWMLASIKGKRKKERRKEKIDEIGNNSMISHLWWRKEEPEWGMMSLLLRFSLIKLFDVQFLAGEILAGVHERSRE
jgi:hypothetical protein